MYKCDNHNYKNYDVRFDNTSLRYANVREMQDESALGFILGTSIVISDVFKEKLKG